MPKDPSIPTLTKLLIPSDQPLIDRDLSWLQFNERVLAEAKDISNPLLERLKFLTITATNLDEFFMIRVASIVRSISKHRKDHNEEKIKRLHSRANVIFRTVRNFAFKQRWILRSLIPPLREAGIHLIRRKELSEDMLATAQAVFAEQILTRLGPPEPLAKGALNSLTNLQLAAVFEDGTWIRLPKEIPLAFFANAPEPRGCQIYFLNDLILRFLPTAMGKGSRAYVIRLTRDGDLDLSLPEEDTESLPDRVRSRLPSREQGRAVRLQYSGDVPAPLREEWIESLRIERRQTFPSLGIMCLNGLYSAAKEAAEKLGVSNSAAVSYPPIRMSVPPSFRKPENLFEILRHKDLLLHHPYDSFDAYVSWIEQACGDDTVVSVEQTVYRIDAVSPVVRALKEAASRKKIRVVIELRARFDELNNLKLADELRQAGVEVYFGIRQLKLHAKVALVTRMEAGNARLYTHLSTGNYNATTARQYTDLAILTSHPEIGADAQNFFNSVCKGQIPAGFKQLVTAPDQLHRRMITLIEAEMKAAREGTPARIVAKVNALVDKGIIEHLYRASGAGVKIDLIVRGACSLIPGLAGRSENIRVISIVDRFLEHSRIYYFQSSRALYLSSADWMPRNFFSRLEIAFPVLDPQIYQFVESVLLPAYLSDTSRARELSSRGTWKRIRPVAGSADHRAQFFFEELASA